MDDDLDLFGWVGGTVDGKYRVDRVVGRGGFGVVYRAHHLGFDQTVAIKCLLLPKTLSGPERDRFQETFLAEGRLLHQLSRATAGIVQALDLGAAVSPNKQWAPYLVLEWLEGRPLDRDFADRRRDGQGGRSITSAIELLTPAAKALQIAHDQGVAHRDIKPANLFIATIAGKPVVKVLDFGIAKVMAETESVTRAFEETGASLQAFTARYGAPEQFSRRYGATGPWTDVFSFALVFVEAVIGRYALDGTDAAQLFVAAADPERRPTLRGMGHETPDAIEDVMKRALAVDPRERYGTAGEFWSALEEAARSCGLLGSEPDSSKRMRSAPEPGFVPVGALASTSAEPVAHVRTELSSSTHVGNTVGTGPPPSRRGSSFGVLLVLGAAALVTGAVGTFAVRQALRDHLPDRQRTAASASLPAASAPAPELAADEGVAPKEPPAPPETETAPAPAPSAPPPSENTAPPVQRAAPPALLGGVPERIAAVAEPDPGVGAVQVGAPLVSPYAGSGFAGNLTTTVFTNDPNNPNGLDSLTFVYRIDTNGGVGLNESIGRLTLDGYNGFLTDASYLAGPGVNPALFTRDNTGNVVGFNFLPPNAIQPGQSSDSLVVQTNATIAVPILASLINGTTATTLALGPAVPEPAAIGALGLAGLVALRRRSR